MFVCTHPDKGFPKHTVSSLVHHCAAKSLCFLGNTSKNSFLFNIKLRAWILLLVFCLLLEELYQGKVSHGLFFQFSLHITQVTPQQSKTRDIKTFQVCSSFFFPPTCSTGLRCYSSHGAACETDPAQRGWKQLQYLQEGEEEGCSERCFQLYFRDRS